MTTIGGGALTQQLHQKLFDRLDVDSSQSLGLDELKAADKARSASDFAKIFEGLDADTDGKISRAEMSAAPALAFPTDSQTAVADLFARADVDGDGRLSSAEMDAEKALRRAQTLDAGQLTGPVFLARDANGDGLLAPDEVAAGQLQKLKPIPADEAPPVQPWRTVRTQDEAAPPPRASTPEQMRQQASADFSLMDMTQTLSTRLMAQILGNLDFAPA